MYLNQCIILNLSLEFYDFRKLHQDSPAAFTDRVERGLGDNKFQGLP